MQAQAAWPAAAVEFEPQPDMAIARAKTAPTVMAQDQWRLLVLAHTQAVAESTDRHPGTVAQRKFSGEVGQG